MRILTAAALFLVATLHADFQASQELSAAELRGEQSIQVQRDSERFVSRVTLTAQDGRIALTDVVRGVARVQGYDDQALGGTLPNWKVKLDGRLSRSLLYSSKRAFGDGVNFTIVRPRSTRGEPKLNLGASMASFT